MKIFISWSKEPSKTVAKALYDWLPTVIQSIEPFMWEEDIGSGSKWHSRISGELATTNFGIVCITPQNQAEPWLQYEAGALAKAVEPPSEISSSSTGSYLCPYLIGMTARALQGPLLDFQSAEATEAGPIIIEGDDDWDGAVPMALEKNFKQRFLHMYRA